MSAETLIASLSDDARALLGRIGRRFGSQQVLAQARQTLAGLDRFAEDLRLHGFGAGDRDRLAAAVAAAAEQPDTDKLTERAYVHALGRAKDARGRARSVLLSAYRRVRASGIVGSSHAWTQVAAIISATAEPGGDDRVYAKHMTRLREVLALPEIAAAVGDSGGPEADALLADALETLQQLDEAGTGKPSTTADVLDGLMVELCRTAQFAAQSVARETGNGNMAGAFRLGKLMKDPASFA